MAICHCRFARFKRFCASLRWAPGRDKRHSFSKRLAARGFPVICCFLVFAVVWATTFARVAVVREREDRCGDPDVSLLPTHHRMDDRDSSPGRSSARGDWWATDGEESLHSGSNSSFEMIDPDAPEIQAEQRIVANVLPAWRRPDIGKPPHRC